MDKIVEALKNLLPENEVNEVANAVSELLEQAKENLESEFNQKLEEAYSELTSELAEAEKIAEHGYEEAYAIIGDLRSRLEVQGQEYKDALEEGYEEAYQMLKSERAKNENIEVEMYEEYDRKLSEMKEYIVDKSISSSKSKEAISTNRLVVTLCQTHACQNIRLHSTRSSTLLPTTSAMTISQKSTLRRSKSQSGKSRNLRDKCVSLKLVTFASAPKIQS